jgi:hypothetical protein
MRENEDQRGQRADDACEVAHVRILAVARVGFVQRSYGNR